MNERFCFDVESPEGNNDIVTENIRLGLKQLRFYAV